MPALSAIYNTRMLDLAANIPHSARLKAPDATACAHSKLCGSKITIDLQMADGKVTGFGQTIKACLLGQAAAAIVGHNIIGSEATELREVGATMRAMLKEGGPPPAGRWADLALLEPVRDYHARHTSTMLVFDAVEKAMDEIKSARTGHQASEDTAQV